MKYTGKLQCAPIPYTIEFKDYLVKSYVDTGSLQWYILKSGCAKKYAFQKSCGGGSNVDLEKSRFDWVFLNVGLPNQIICFLCLGFTKYE